MIVFFRINYFVFIFIFSKIIVIVEKLKMAYILLGRYSNCFCLGGCFENTV